MGTTIRLRASDGHEFDAYRADPPAKPRGGIVVAQEIFGVNAHIRSVADAFAREGYAVVAPALFDRVECNVEMGYGEDETKKGRALRTKLGFDPPMLDIGAAMGILRPLGRVGIVGFCWGGSLAWLAACRLETAGAVCYYGAQIKDFLSERPHAPVLMHFGEKDPLIPKETVAAIRAAQPDVAIYTYAAGHGFNCDVRADYDPAGAALAWQRTREFLRKHVG